MTLFHGLEVTVLKGSKEILENTMPHLNEKDRSIVDLYIICAEIYRNSNGTNAFAER